MLTPPLVEYAVALLNTISLSDALLSSRSVLGAKKERLQAFRNDAAQVLVLTVGVELPSGQIADLDAGDRGK